MENWVIGSTANLHWRLSGPEDELGVGRAAEFQVIGEFARPVRGCRSVNDNGVGLLKVGSAI